MGTLFFSVDGLAGTNQLAQETVQWRDRCGRALRAAVAQQGWADDGGTVTVEVTVYSGRDSESPNRALTTVMETVAALTGGENPVLPPPAARIRALTFYEPADDGDVASDDLVVVEGVAVAVKAGWDK